MYNLGVEQPRMTGSLMLMLRSQPGDVLKANIILDKSPKPGRIEPMQPDLFVLRSRRTLSHPQLRKAGLLASG